MYWPIEVLLWLKFVKLLAVSGFAAGTLGAFMSRDWQDRKRYAFGVAGPAFGLTWLSGILMAVGNAVSLFALWILIAAASSFISLQIALFCAAKEERNSIRAGVIAHLLLVAAVAAMLWRPNWD